MINEGGKIKDRKGAAGEDFTEPVLLQKMEGCCLRVVSCETWPDDMLPLPLHSVRRKLIIWQLIEWLLARPTCPEYYLIIR